MSKTKVPSIPAPTDANLREVARAVKGVLDVREGLIGDPLDAAVTFRDLVDGGVVTVTTINRGGGSSSISVAPGGAGDGYDPAADLTPPPAPTGFAVSGGLTTVFLQWNAPTYSNHAYTEIWRSTTNVIGNALRIGTTDTFLYSDAVGNTGTVYYYWIRFVSKADITGPYNSASGTQGGTGRIGNVDLNPLIIEAGNLASGAVTASKLAAGAVDLTKFANSIEPITVVTGTLPTTKSTSSIFRTDDGKLYRWNGTAYVASVPAVDVTGQLTDAQLADIAAAKITGQVVASQIADASMTVAKFASGIEPLTIVTGTLPTTKSTNTIFRTDDSKTYRWNGTAYVATVPAADIAGQVTDAQVAGLAASKVTGQLTNSQIADVAAAKLTGQVVASQIADASISTAKFASGIEPITVVTGSTLPTTKSTNSIYLTGTGKMYRWVGSAYSAVVDTSDLNGTITDAQLAGIAASKVTGQLSDSQLAAISAAKVTGQLTASQLSVSIGGGNLLRNSGFEVGGGNLPGVAGDWVVFNGGAGDSGRILSCSLDAGMPGIIGSLCQFVQIVSATNSQDTGIHIASTVPVIAGQTYTASAYINPSVGGKVHVLLRFYDSVGNSLGDHYSATAPAGAWTRVSVSAAAPANSTQVHFMVRGVTASSESFRVDGAQLEQATLISTYAPRPDEILASTITSTEIADNAITSPKIVAGSVVAGKIAAGAVSATEIAAGAVTTAKLAAGAVTANEIAADTITASQIAANAITSSELAAGAVVAGKIAAGSIQAADIAAGTITGDRLAANTITASQIAGNTITAGQIAAGAIGASQIAAGAITTEKLLVAGRGTAINDDPMFTDPSAWLLSANVAFNTGTGVSGAVANTYIGTSSGTDQTNYSVKYFPIGPGKRYRLTANVFAAAGNTRNMYLFVQFYDQNGAYVDYSVTGWGGTMSGYTYGGAPPTDVWTRVGAQFGSGTGLAIPANVRSCKIGIWFQYSGGPGSSQVYQACQDIRLEELVEAGLIVDGAIVASKVAAGAITTAKIAAGAVTAGEIASDAVTAAKIQAGSVTTAKIAAGAVTANEIAAATITGGKIAAGTITGSNIAADTITAGQIAAGAITASELAAGSVRASKLLLAPSSMFPEACPTENNIWTWDSGWSIQVTPSYYPGVLGVPSVLLWNDPGRVGRSHAYGAWNQNLPITPGKQYTLRWRWVRSGDCSDWFRTAVYYFDAAGSVITADYSAFMNTANGASSGSMDFTPPTNTARYALLVFNEYTTTTWAGFFFISDFRVSEKASSELIVDGAVTAVKVAAGSIITEKLAAGAVTADTIAANAITTPKIATDAITSDKIAANAVTADEIAANAITTGKIAAGAVSAAQIAAGAITTDKLLVTGRGQALNADPNTQDITAWIGSVSVFADPTAPSGGGNSLRATAGGSFFTKEVIPIDELKNHQLRMWVIQESGASTAYLTVIFYDSSLNVLYGSSHPTGWPSSGTYHYFGVTGAQPPSTWAEYRISFGPGETAKIPAGAKYLQVGALTNYAGSGVQRYAGIRLMLKADADLIVDGAIIASKIAANAIAVGTAAIQNGAIVNAMLGNAVIDSAKIADGAIVTAKIGDAQITNAKIGGTIQSDNYSAGSAGWAINKTSGFAEFGAASIRGQLTASQINSNGLTIRDNSGNILFGVSNNLDYNRINPSSGWLNSNISVSASTGAISGIGTGDGQSVANNTDSVIRAPGGGVFTTQASVVTGAIKICLPQSWTDTMMRFTVEVYEYNTGYMCTLEIGGYNYSGGTYWVNVSARVIGGSNVEYPVYFGHDGTKCCIWIGAYNETWSYPQVRVRDFFAGYNNVSRDLWASGWQISFDTTNITSGTGTNQFSASVVDTFPGADWSKTARRPSNLASLSGGEAIQNNQITISSNAIQGIGSGAGTVVANTAISVDTSTGAIIGIGTGNGESVANNVNSRIMAPSGGIFTSGSSGMSGSIRIRLPALVNSTYTMVKFTVEIYEYVSGYSTTLAIAGHTSGTGWYEVTAILAAGNIEYPVYFGHDGTYFVVWIGNPSETWQYPQVFVTNVLVGYSSTQASLWASNWNISLDTSAATNVTRSVLDTYPAADWSKTARRPSNLTSLTGSEAIQNSQITISGGALQGIGSGAGTAVANANISIGSNGALSGAGGGQVTIGGLGYSGDLNATYGATAGNNLLDSNGRTIGDAKFLGNLLDVTRWVPDSSGSQPGFGENGTSSGGANYIAYDTLPSGVKGVHWRARSGSAAGTGPEGGWNGDLFKIDPTKMYRFTVWIRCFGGNASGSFYLGCGGSSVQDIGGGTNSNPYFVARGRNEIPDSNWVLCVGYVFPANYSGSQENRGGIYRASDGVKILNGTDFRWVPGQTTSLHRTYQYYTNQANNYQDFYDPRVEIMDGSEPSLSALLSMGAVSGRNPINASNVSTNIAADTIGITQLGTDIQTTNYSANSAGWRITKAGAAYFNNVSVRGEINGGAFTGYAWPASGTGFHVGPSGILLGNYNVVLGNGKRRYFQIESGGNVYSPGFNIIDGDAVFSGTVSANVINTDAIVGGAAAAASSATSTGASASVTVTVPANASALLIEYYLGPPTFSAGAGGDKYGQGGTPDVYGPVLTGLTANGSTISSITVAPAAGTYTITASRSYYTGTMRLGVIVLKR